MEKRILGIDPGLATLGFGAIACSAGSGGYSKDQLGDRPPDRLGSRSGGRSVVALDYGVIRTPAKTDIGERLIILHDDLHTLMQQWQPDLVAIEKLFFYRMGNTIAVAQARGVLLLVLAQCRVPIVEFTPAQIKQALTGHGNADKYEVQLAVTRELSLDQIPQPDDAADGLAVALAAWFQI